MIISDMRGRPWYREPLTHHVVCHPGHLADLSRQGSAEVVRVETLGTERAEERTREECDEQMWIVVDRCASRLRGLRPDHMLTVRTSMLGSFLVKFESMVTTTTIISTNRVVISVPNVHKPNIHPSEY